MTDQDETILGKFLKDEEMEFENIMEDERFINTCNFCGKEVNSKNKCIRVLRNGKEYKIQFDTYDCYLNFWKNFPDFIPLPLFIDK